MYQLIIKPRAKKGLSKLHPKDQKEVLEALNILRNQPFGNLLNIIKLANTERSYRIRIGRLRIIYELFTKERLIFVRLIDYRRTGTYKSPWL